MEKYSWEIEASINTMPERQIEVRFGSCPEESAKLKKAFSWDEKIPPVTVPITLAMFRSYRAPGPIVNENACPWSESLNFLKKKIEKAL